MLDKKNKSEECNVVNTQLASSIGARLPQLYQRKAIT